MGFLIGLIGLGLGAFGFWLDFSADPFAGVPKLAGVDSFDIGVAGVCIAIAGFLLQMWSPKFRGRKSRMLAALSAAEEA